MDKITFDIYSLIATTESQQYSRQCGIITGRMGSGHDNSLAMINARLFVNN